MTDKAPILIEEYNMGHMNSEEAEMFFDMVREDLGLENFGFEITETAPSICLRDKILLCENDLQYPWHTKQMILHELAHHLIPDDTTHGTKFHQQYAELVCKYIGGKNLLLKAQMPDKEAVNILKKAVENIKLWHDYPVRGRITEERIESAWNIYYDQAPEMEAIREYIEQADSILQSEAEGLAPNETEGESE